jgi:S1-C subfamily serine protease
MKLKIGKPLEAQKVSLEAAKPAVKGATFSENGGSVVVTDVEQGSPAWNAGLRPKDVVIGVNRKPVKSVEELTAELKDSNRQTALFLQRDGQDMLIVVQ